MTTLYLQDGLKQSRSGNVLQMARDFLETTYRRFAVDLHDHVVAMAETSQQLYCQNSVRIASTHMNSDRGGKDFSCWLQLGRRWKELCVLFGDAIILAGTFALDHTPLLNIPLIVETWSEDAFQCINSLLKIQRQALQDTCGKLESFLAFLLDHRVWCKPASSYSSFTQGLATIFDAETAVNSLLAELQPPVGKDALARQLIDRLLVDEGTGSGSMSWEAVAYSVDVLLEVMPLQCLMHDRGLSEVREATVARVLAHESLDVTRDEVEYYVDKIMDSFGAVIARAGI